MGRISSSLAPRRPDIAATTAAREAVGRLKRDILLGELAPETKLKLRDMKSRYGFGASPMREALSQLAAEGWVAQVAQRGFRVPAISAEEFVDLTRTRQIVEKEALLGAMQAGDAAWEDEIVTSFHLYAREVERADASGLADTEAREERHHRFHRALLAACPLFALRTFCDDLYTRMTRYRCILRIHGTSSRKLIEEHRRLMSLVLARDVKAAGTAIDVHIAQTATVCLKVLGELKPGAPPPADTPPATLLRRRRTVPGAARRTR